MFPEWQHQIILTAPAPTDVARTPRDLIQVTAGLHYLQGNARPYFSVTAAVGTARQLQTGDYHTGGCCHETVIAVWPALAPVVALHLSDDRGVPMHAEANAVYFAGRSRAFGSPGYYPAHVAHLRSHLRISEEDAQALINDAPTRAAIEDYVRAQYPRWQAEATQAIAVLQALAQAAAGT